MGFFKNLFGGKPSVEEKAIEYNNKITKAAIKGDFKKLGKLEEERNKWYESLSDDDKEKANNATVQAMGEQLDKLGKDLISKM